MRNSIIKKSFRYQYYNAAFILIGINIALFLLNTVAPQTRGFLALNPVLVLRRGFIWQVFTYMFAHANISHILFNMLGLFFFGVQLERRVGSSEFLLYYLLTGLLAGVFSLLVYWYTGNYRVWLLGASGAVFAVLLAFATYFPDSRIFVFGILPIKAPLLVTIYAGIELFSQFTSTASGVAHLTHLAGFGFGFLYFVLRLNINPVKVFFGKDRYYH